MSKLAILTIGNFDGVHRGHQALVRTARELARAGTEPGRVIVLAFDPHPASVLRPDDAPPRLSTFPQRERWLEEVGASEVVALRPEPDLLQLEPEAFIRRVVDQYKPFAFVEGADFRFGKDRSGSVQTLADIGRNLGFQTRIIDPVTATLTDQSVVRVSSSMIRWLLVRGRVRDAAALLGRPYELQGPVVPGDRRGRELGVPTANLHECEQLLPADGIYSGLAIRADDSTYPAAISIGTKPTFGDNPRICEAHLLGFNGPLDDYGWPLRLEIHDWIRDQLRYPDIASLSEQIQRDLRRVELDLSPRLVGA